jgi:ribonuclease J
MNLIIHRGTHEIGGNCVEITASNTRIIIDLGIPLSDPRNRNNKFDNSIIRRRTVPELIADGILPKIQGLYTTRTSEKPVDAVLISHPHQDHYGLCRFIRKDVPILIGEDTSKMLKVSDVFLNNLFGSHDHTGILKDNWQSIGNIRIKPYLMDHSGYGAMAFLIEADRKRVFYTGDFRAHGRKKELFERFLKRHHGKINTLIMEGTMLGRKEERVRTEKDLEIDIAKDAALHPGLKFFVCSGQNVDRVVTFHNAAKRTGSTFVLDLYGANVLYELGRKSLPIPTNGFKNVKVLFTKHFMKKLSIYNKKQWYTRWRDHEISPEALSRLNGKAFVMYRERSVSELERAYIPKGSVLFYSQWRNYMKEKSFDPTRDFIKKHKIRLIEAHTSGHAPIKDLKRLVHALKPDCIVPIHTQERDEYCTHFGKKVCLLNDGENFQI